MNTQNAYQISFWILAFYLFCPIKAFSLNLVLPVGINSHQIAGAKIALTHNVPQYLAWIEYSKYIPFTSLQYLQRLQFKALQGGDLLNQQSIGMGYGRFVSNDLTITGYGYLDWIKIAGFPSQNSFKQIPYVNGTLGIALQYQLYRINMSGYKTTHWGQQEPFPLSSKMKNLMSHLAIMSQPKIVELDKWGFDFQITTSYWKWIEPFIGAYYTHINLVIPNMTCCLMQETPMLPLNYTFQQPKDIIGASLGAKLSLFNITATLDTLRGPEIKVALNFDMYLKLQNASEKISTLNYNSAVRRVEPHRPYYATTTLQDWDLVKWENCCTPQLHCLEVAKVLHSSILQLPNSSSFQNYLEIFNEEISPEILHQYHTIISNLGKDEPFKQFLIKSRGIFNPGGSKSIPSSLITFMEKIQAELSTLEENGTLSTLAALEKIIHQLETQNMLEIVDD